MQNFEFIPPKKIFSQDFILENKTLFTLTYKQATLGEFFDFYSKPKEEQFKEIIELIKSQIPYSIFDKIKKITNPYYQNQIEKLINYEKLIVNVLSNRFRTYKSIFEGIKTGNPGKKIKGLVRNSLAKVCDFWNIGFDKLISDYTIEQFLWFLDGVRFYENSQSKEGQQINNQALIDKESIQKRAEETKKAFEKFKI